MKLIVGLGNPEPVYHLTRHNVGFMLLDHVAAQLGATWQSRPKFKGLVAETAIDGQKVMLLKPSTYYNLSGEAVRAVVDFYKLSAAQDVLVLHDELMLPFGTLRTRLSGSDAGNNGIKSVIQHIGSDFARIRVGIANTHTPHANAADFVISRFAQQEQAQLDEIARHALGFIEDFIHQEREFAPTSVQVQKDQP